VYFQESVLCHLLSIAAFPKYFKGQAVSERVVLSYERTQGLPIARNNPAHSLLLVQEGVRAMEHPANVCGAPSSNTDTESCLLLRRSTAYIPTDGILRQI
jgi:hypothetical protein